MASDMLVKKHDQQLAKSADDELAYLIVAHVRPRGGRPETIFSQAHAPVQSAAR
jgi:hypothetical protein